jgi:hypothetical protein
MFYSCRICHRPTNLWLDFCDECALAEDPPALRAVEGGRDGERDARLEDDERKRNKESHLTLVRG